MRDGEDDRERGGIESRESEEGDRERERERERECV